VKIAGAWVGFGLGDADPKIAWFRDKLRPKFSYARNLPEAKKNVIVDGRVVQMPYFDEALELVVATAQKNWGINPTGIIDHAFQKKAGWIATPPPSQRNTGPRGTLYTCQGTVPSTMWSGPQADVARQVEDLYYRQPIGGPYTAFPMNPSIKESKALMLAEIEERPVGDPINAIGFSQGGIIISEVYTDMKRSGHPRFKDWRRAWTFANPSRELGVENGNRFAGLPILGKKKRGIMQESRRMEDTPDWWMDQGNKGDLYFDCENDDEGEFKEAICMAVMGNLWGGPNSLPRQVFELASSPLEVMHMFKAIMDAGMFFGGGIKPHLAHDIRPAVNYFRS
jgi:hypothetical protein